MMVKMMVYIFFNRQGKATVDRQTGANDTTRIVLEWISYFSASNFEYVIC